MCKYYLTFFLLLVLNVPSYSISTQGESNIDRVALQFREALNAGKVELLVKNISAPIVVVEQEWVSAKDGAGFVLGERDVTYLSNMPQIRKHFNFLKKKIQIEGKEVTVMSISRCSRFSVQLSGINIHWRKLKLAIMLRGFGDVEHIVLLGIDPLSKKIRLIYYN